MNNFFDRTFGKPQRPAGRTYRQGQGEMPGNSGYYRGMDDRRYADDRSYADDEYLLDEIARLKAQTEELRQILYDRQSQMDEINKNNNAAILKLAESLNSIAAKIDKAENTITDTVENSQELIHESIHNSIEDGLALANKPMEAAYKKIADELQENIDSFKFEMASSSDKIEEMKNTVDGLQKILEEKADKAPVVSLHQRFTTMFAVNVVGLVGTIMTLGLLCYLIISIAR